MIFFFFDSYPPRKKIKNEIKCILNTKNSEFIRLEFCRNICVFCWHSIFKPTGVISGGGAGRCRQVIATRWQHRAGNLENYKPDSLTGSLTLLPSSSTGGKEIWLACCDRLKVCPTPFKTFSMEKWNKPDKKEGKKEEQLSFKDEKCETEEKMQTSRLPLQWNNHQCLHFQFLNLIILLNWFILQDRNQIMEPDSRGRPAAGVFCNSELQCFHIQVTTGKQEQLKETSSLDSQTIHRQTSEAAERVC